MYSVTIIEVSLPNGPHYWAEWYKSRGIVVFGGDWHKVPDLQSHSMPEPDDCQAWADMHTGDDQAWKQASDNKARKTTRKTTKAQATSTPRFSFTPKKVFNLVPVKHFTPDTPEVTAIRAKIFAKKLQLTNETN